MTKVMSSNNISADNGETIVPRASAMNLVAPPPTDSNNNTTTGLSTSSNPLLPGGTSMIENLEQDPALQQQEVYDDEYYVGGLFSIENSPAFKALDALVGKKDVPQSRIDEMRARIRSLHQHLLVTSTYEKSLQKKAKTLTLEVQNQRMEIDKTGTKQYANNAEIGDLKRNLLKVENELALSVDREAKLQREIEEGLRVKSEIEADIDEIRRHKADMLEPQLIAATKELKIDLAQRRHQVENLQKDLEEKEATLQTVLQEKERLDNERERHAMSLAKATETPAKILKQSEVFRDAISSLVIENVKQNTLALQLDADLERLAKKRKELEEIKLDVAAEHEQRRAEIGELEGQCDDIYKQHEFARDQLSVQKAERVRLDLALKGIQGQIKREHDILVRTIREKETQLKTHRRLQTTVNNIKMSTPLILRQAADHARLLEAAKREEVYQQKRMAELRKEIDMQLFEYLQLEEGEKTEEEKAGAQRELNRRMELELEEVRARRLELSRGLESLKAEKELKARELTRIQAKYRSIKEDVVMKDIAIVESSKSCSESMARLRDFAALYDVVKNERNKYVNQIQAITQRSAEMKEKIKILSNEIEILRHEIMSKDRELTKKRQENTASYAVRDAAKNDANKLLATYRSRRDQIDQHLSRIETLNTLINAAEEDMVHLKHRYERAMSDRNSVGVHLLDRNDELAILYERFNIQAGVMTKGEAALKDREEDLRQLRIVKSELERRLELKKKKRPEVIELRQRLEQLNEEHAQAKARVAELSARMESPEDPDRCRDLGGKDPDPGELTEKIKKLELMLAEKEEKLLEKDLVLEEVNTLTERLKKQTMDGRGESHEVTARMNELSKKIKHATKGIMARVSELSMYQALAMGLYQEKCEKDALLEEARARLARGEMPTEEIEKEFIRAERLRLKREKEIMALREAREKQSQPNYIEIDDDEFYIISNLRTKAEPRPNAYIPGSQGVGELPIPKPYGAHAPFKPQEHGAQIRHFRKPVVKPVEI
ncbi:hypothetical protein HDV05_004193 [Chytridiales sp. JEL 0842]|nr:hypothetical protein HDV05_004193 [Chytridiales sp. JEL 0842]